MLTHHEREPSVNGHPQQHGQTMLLNIPNCHTDLIKITQFVLTFSTPTAQRTQPTAFLFFVSDGWSAIRRRSTARRPGPLPSTERLCHTRGHNGLRPPRRLMSPTPTFKCHPYFKLRKPAKKGEVA